LSPVLTQTYRLRLLKGDEIVSEEFFSATSFEMARLIMRTRVLSLRAVVKYEVTHELVPAENEPSELRSPSDGGTLSKALGTK
jgi:hypothetical protein